MINLTLRGTVVKRWWLEQPHKGMVAVIRIRFEQFVDGEKKPVLVDVWFPKFFDKRQKFIMNEAVKTVTITANALGVLPKQQASDQDVCCAVIASEIYL